MYIKDLLNNLEIQRLVAEQNIKDNINKDFFDGELCAFSYCINLIRIFNGLDTKLELYDVSE